tara:strand:- start:308 stop:535 length:228 start_codon:yes stop_codon:yes gene_type:complete
MLLRLRLLLLSFGGGVLLLLLLCLGAQNLSERTSIKVGASRSVPLPTGFLVGVSFVIGVISGGSAAAVLLPDQRA